MRHGGVAERFEDLGARIVLVSVGLELGTVGPLTEASSGLAACRGLGASPPRLGSHSAGALVAIVVRVVPAGLGLG